MARPGLNPRSSSHKWEVVWLNYLTIQVIALLKRWHREFEKKLQATATASRKCLLSIIKNEAICLFKSVIYGRPILDMLLTWKCKKCSKLRYCTLQKSTLQHLSLSSAVGRTEVIFQIHFVSMGLVCVEFRFRWDTEAREGWEGVWVSRQF